MKANHIIVLAALTLLASCKKDNQTYLDDTATDTITKVIDSTALSNKSATGRYHLQQLITPFIAQKKKVEEQLKTATQEEANKLYDSYFEANLKVLSKIMEKEHNITDNFYSYFYDDKGLVTPPDSIQRKVELLKSARLDFNELGEGYVDICLAPDFYYTLFKKYVTNDYKEYIRIKAEEDKVMYSADAGLMITFKGASERVLNWENFIEKYPDSKFISNAKENYFSYQNDYFFGEDNTPAHDDSGKYFEENIKEYNRFITSNPNSFTSKLAKIALEHSGSKDDLHKIIRKEQQKHLGI